MDTTGGMLQQASLWPWVAGMGDILAVWCREGLLVRVLLFEKELCELEWKSLDEGEGVVGATEGGWCPDL